MIYSYLIIACLISVCSPVQGMYKLFFNKDEDVKEDGDHVAAVLTAEEQKLIDNRLLDAISKKNIKAVRKALDSGADINTQEDHGCTPLMRASRARNASVDIVTLLLDSKADVMAKNRGATALDFALYEDNKDIIKFLLGKDTTLDENTNNLLVAALCGKFRRVRMLLTERACKPLVYSEGADARSMDGSTPLMWAAYAGHSNVARLLVENGATVNAVNKKGETALLWASRHGHVDMVRFLCACGAPVNGKDEDDYIPLIEAVKGSHMGTVQVLLDNNAFIDAARCGGRTPLIEALERVRKCPKMVDILLDRGVNVNKSDNAGQTPLMIISDTKLIRKLIAKKADINVKDKQGNTFLIKIAPHGKSSVVEFFLNLKSSVYEVNDQDETPLMKAVQYNNTHVARLLLDRGAQVEARSKEGKTPLMHVSFWRNSGEIIDLLLQRGADRNAVSTLDEKGKTPLMWAIKYKHAMAVNQFLDKGVDINGANKGGITPLMSAVYANYDEMVKLLLMRKADSNQRAATGVTALTIAACKGYGTIVQLLLDNKADVNGLCGDTGVPSPLMQAVYECNINTVQLLIRAGADLLYSDREGKTALSNAQTDEIRNIITVAQEAQAHVDGRNWTTKKLVESGILKNFLGVQALEQLIGDYVSQETRDLLFDLLAGECLQRNSRLCDAQEHEQALQVPEDRQIYFCGHRFIEWVANRKKV